MINRFIPQFVSAVALLPALLLSTPARANPSDDCELQRQEHCYGESNMFKACFEMSGDARDICLRWSVTYCEHAMPLVCDSAQSSSNGAGYVTEVSCPPGSAPDTLGRCVAILTGTEETPDIDPTDWCPGGTVPGPHDDCVPLIATVRVMPTDGGWFVSCPPGSVPSPIDGCMPDFGSVTEWTQGCPPGFSPGPRDECVPHRINGAIGNLAGTLLLDGLIKSGVMTDGDPGMVEEALLACGVARVENPEAAIAEFAASMGAQVQPQVPE